MDDATFQKVRFRFFVALLTGVAALSLLVAGFFVAAVPLTTAAACLFLICMTALAQWLELASRGPSNN
ncbi:hypothetical protein EB232_22280 [Mesorhizobium sp. NZP2077]|nr:hypothetical protein EB232_22280 [Mesorhizobium sp. NZP2077]